jgi:YggT family protein
MVIICVLLSVYFWILFIRILASWFPAPMSGPLRAVWTLLYDLTDPVLRPLRNVIPPVRFGAMALDLSPILVFVILGVIQAALHCGTVGL